MKRIWVNGCFDILHKGHIELLKFARSKGEYLVVGIDSDRRVKNAKGSKRPINDQDTRKYMLESLKCVDDVTIFDDEAEFYVRLKEYNVDTIIVGDEYRNGFVLGREAVENVDFFPKIDGMSTTNFIEKIKKL